MQFTEQVNVNAVKWLLSKLSDEFIKTHMQDDEDNLFKFTNIKKILQNYEKHNGVVKVLYKKTDKFGLLRDYGQGIQSMPSLFRGLIARNMVDCDMVNAHPVIILNLCRKNSIICHYLEEYCKHRNTIIERGDTTKLDVIRSINKKNKLKNVSPWMTSFDNEMKEIQKRFLVLPEYEPHRELARKNNKNMEGSMMSHIATSQEVVILHTLLQHIKVDIGVLMFDGFMFYGEKPEGFLESLSVLIKERLDFDVQFSYKEHNQTLVIPSNWVSDDPEQLYEAMKQKYERDYGLAFIQKNTSYAFKINNQIGFFSHTDIQHLLETEKIGKETFWSKWKTDSSRQTFSDFGTYPHDVECPDGWLNLWAGYDAEKIPHSNADISPMLEHIKILMKTEEVYNHMLDWFANMLQFPSSQSIMMIWKSTEGSGKSLVMDFIRAIMGSHLSDEVADAKESMFSRFNDNLAGKVFQNINETNRQIMLPFIEKLKTLITSPTLAIEAKGQKKYTLSNMLHMIMTLNPDNPIPIQEGSRRFSYVECSDELIGNFEYFNHLGEWITKKSNQRAFYQFLMERPVKKHLTAKDIPITEDMEKMYELNREPIESYAMDFTGKKSAMVNYEHYIHYLTQNGLDFKVSKKNFEYKFGKYMNKYGIVKSREMNDGDRQTYYSRTLLIA